MKVLGSTLVHTLYAVDETDCRLHLLTRVLNNPCPPALAWKAHASSHAAVRRDLPEPSCISSSSGRSTVRSSASTHPSPTQKRTAKNQPNSSMYIFITGNIDKNNKHHTPTPNRSPRLQTQLERRQPKRKKRSVTGSRGKAHYPNGKGGVHGAYVCMSTCVQTYICIIAEQRQRCQMYIRR